MGFRTGLIAVLFLASGCAAPLVLDDDGALVLVPHEIGSGGLIIVNAMINDQGPFKFALDTGASISVIFEQTREAVGLDVIEEPQVHIHGMLGADDFPTTLIAQLTVGTESWTDAHVALLPDNAMISEELDGILGVDFLSRYAVGVSARDQVVRLYPPLLVRDRSYRGWTSIPLHQLPVGEGDASAYVIELNINGITIPALLDLGAGFNMMNWRAARALRVRPNRAGNKGTISGALETEPVTAELVVSELRIKAIHWRNRTFMIADFDIFEFLNLNNRPVALVGPKLFQERDFVIDFERKRLLIRAGR